jgi:hypothetical protein
MTMTLDQALALCEHASPMPHLAGQALRVMRDEIARLNELTDRFSAAINEMTGPTFMGEPVLPHPDNTAVDAFAVAMKAKLAEARAKGRGGWQDKDNCPQQRLSDMLRAHVEKGDPRDVANFCMFLHQRGEAILPVPPGAGQADLLTRGRVAARALARERKVYAEDIDTLADVVKALEALAAQPAERQGEVGERGGPSRLHGWKAKRTDCPGIKGWVITPPEGCGVLVEDGENTSGSDMLREIAIHLSSVPPASSVCPICGFDSPHKHSGEEVAKYRGAITHSAAPVGVPDGMVLVPREPTPEMKQRGAYVVSGVTQEGAAATWAAMLAAAPSAPQALRTPSFAELQTWALCNGMSGASDQEALDAWRAAAPPVPTLEQFKRMGWGEAEKNAADQAASAPQDAQKERK